MRTDVDRSNSYLVRIQVEKWTDDVTTAVWQSGICWSGHKEWRIVGRRQTLVVDDVEVAIPTTEVAHVDRHPRGEFLLNAGRKFPLKWAISPSLPCLRQ